MSRRLLKTRVPTQQIMEHRLKILVFWLRIKVNSRVDILTAQTLFSLRNAGNGVSEGNITKTFPGMHAPGHPLPPLKRASKALLSCLWCETNFLTDFVLSAKNCLGTLLTRKIYVRKFDEDHFDNMGIKLRN